MGAEKNFENKVKAFIIRLGGWYIKYWAGAKYTKEGVPDILACIHGAFYGIEIKAAEGRPKLVQLIKLRLIREAGGFGLLLYPDDFQGFKELINGTTAGDTWYKTNIEKQETWIKRFTG